MVSPAVKECFERASAAAGPQQEALAKLAQFDLPTGYYAHKGVLYHVCGKDVRVVGAVEVIE